MRISPLRRKAYTRSLSINGIGRRSICFLPCRNHVKSMIAVGIALSGDPPHRSVREELPHTAPALSRARNRSLG